MAAWEHCCSPFHGLQKCFIIYRSEPDICVHIVYTCSIHTPESSFISHCLCTVGLCAFGIILLPREMRNDSVGNFLEEVIQGRESCRSVCIGGCRFQLQVCGGRRENSGVPVLTVGVPMGMWCPKHLWVSAQRSLGIMKYGLVTPLSSSPLARGCQEGPRRFGH